MQKTKKILASSLAFIPIFLMLIVPAFSSADGLVPCDNVTKACDFNALMSLVNILIKFVLFDMAIPIAAIMFAYAGFLLVTAQGGEAKTKAKNIFTNAVIGLAIAVAAWLIVNTILSILGYNGTWIGFVMPTS